MTKPAVVSAFACLVFMLSGGIASSELMLMRWHQPASGMGVL
jgi:hypothetical protein